MDWFSAKVLSELFIVKAEGSRVRSVLNRSCMLSLNGASQLFVIAYFR